MTSWDTSNVAEFGGLFESSDAITIDLSNMVIRGGAETDAMFMSCNKLEILKLGASTKVKEGSELGDVFMGETPRVGVWHLEGSAADENNLTSTELMSLTAGGNAAGTWHWVDSKRTLSQENTSVTFEGISTYSGSEIVPLSCTHR